MYEVKFDENINLENIIDGSKKKKGKIFTLSYLISVLSLMTLSLTTISAFDLHLYYTTKELLFGVLAINAAIDGGLILGKVVINSFITSRNKHCKTVLSKLVATLGNNNVKTSVRELSDSVLFERVNTITETTIDEDLSITSDTTKEDKCFAFLDKNSEIQGLLERTITSEVDDELMTERQYFVLEEPELMEVVPRVEMVKNWLKNLVKI